MKSTIRGKLNQVKVYDVYRNSNSRNTYPRREDWKGDEHLINFGLKLQIGKETEDHRENLQ